MFVPEFKQVTTKEFGFLFRICLMRINADLSPVKTFPSSSQKILLSPSPSNAIPKSALFSKTVFERTERFCGVGSEPRPGNLPSTISFTRITSQLNFLQKSGAVTACAPLPKSKTTLKGFDSIRLESICVIIPLRYVSIVLVSSLVIPHFSGLGNQFFWCRYLQLIIHLHGKFQHHLFQQV